MYIPNLRNQTDEAQYICPAEINENCKWEGKASAVLNHFKKEHHELVIASNVIKTDISQDNVLNRLMVSDDEIFLVQTTFQANDAKLRICLRYLGSPERASKIRYVLDVNGTHDVGSFACDSIEEQNEHPAFKYVNGALEIKVDRVTSAKDFVECTVNVEKIQDDVFVADAPIVGDQMSEEDMLEMLKCVLCRNYIFPPILSCLNGHSLCQECKDNACDICGLQGTARRNSELEEISKQVKCPCKFTDCKERFHLEALKEHEMGCTKVVYRCAVCLYSTYKGTLVEMRQHFKSIHPSVRISVSMEIEILKGTECVVLSERGMFYCSSIARNSDITWRIQFCGPAERVKQFSCEVIVKGKGKRGKNHGKVYQLELVKKTFVLDIKHEDFKKFQLQDKSAVLCIFEENSLSETQHLYMFT